MLYIIVCVVEKMFEALFFTSIMQNYSKHMTNQTCFIKTYKASRIKASFHAHSKPRKRN